MLSFAFLCEFLSALCVQENVWLSSCPSFVTDSLSLGVLSSFCTPSGCGMIFQISSGGLATTGELLAALQAANFLGNSILGRHLTAPNG